MPTADIHIHSGPFDRYILSPLGLDRDNSMVAWLLLILAGITLGGFILFEGNILGVIALLFMTAIVLLTFLRVDYSLYLLMFSVMLFDQYAIPNFTPITYELRFFNNLKEMPFLPSFPGGVVNVVELHLFLLILSLGVVASVKRDFTFKPIPVFVPFIIFVGALMLSFAYGLRGGGDLMVAMWEVRALFYLCIMYLMVPQIISTRKQLTILVWIFIVGISIKAFQGIARFVSLGFTTGGYDVLTNHEDPVFTVTLFIMLLAFLVFGVNHKQRLWLILLLVPLLLGFYVAQRRASYASLIVCIGTFIVLLPMLHRWTFLKFFLPVLGALVLYGALFWNDDSRLGRPVQMIKSGIEKPDLELNNRDYHSNLYRELENYNLAQTVANNPVLGVGFGKRYEQPLPLVEIRFTLRDYIPHNQIMWVLVKMGSIGFLAFWFFFNAFVARGTRTMHLLKDPYLKAISVVIVIAIINQMVVSWYDLQLTYYRNMLYLGCLMGLLPVLEHIQSNIKSEPAETEKDE